MAKLEIETILLRWLIQAVRESLQARNELAEHYLSDLELQIASAEFQAEDKP